MDANLANPGALNALVHMYQIPLPPLPAALLQQLEPCGKAAVATPGWRGISSIEAAQAQWLSQPTSPANAWIGITGHGLQSGALGVYVGLPHAGFFLRKQWDAAYDGAERSRGKIEGTFGLLGRLLPLVERLNATHRWPTGRRFMLVDDDFSRLAWGWGAENDEAPPLLQADGLAYVSALVALEGALAQPAAAAA